MTLSETEDHPATSERQSGRPARRVALASPTWSMREGRVIDNAISGERIVIRKSGAQTGGRMLAFDLFLPPGGHVPAGHVHPVQEERFTVVAGRMRFRVGRRTILASPGQTVRVPPGTPHWFGNAGLDVALTRVTVRPALRMEELLQRTGSLGEVGHLPGTHIPRLSDLALVLLEFQRELGVPNVPAVVVRVVLAPLAWLARRSARRRRR
ncbi:MAG: cupin domain-containing protein [Chloroflexota bacterium]